MTVTGCTSSVDLRAISPRERHATIFAAFRALDLGGEFEVVSDYDPKPLYYQFRTEVPGGFAWVYTQHGPDVWRVGIAKLARAHGDGECCGVCSCGN